MLEMVEDVAGLKVGMASIEDKLDELSHRLLGNGQPRLIADLQSTDRILAEKIEQVEKGRTTGRYLDWLLWRSRCHFHPD